MNPPARRPVSRSVPAADDQPCAALPGLAGLGAVASTLLIPLAARAHGDAMFPQVAVGDAVAPRALAALGVDAVAATSNYLADRATVYGVLARTRIFRERAQDFFAEHPRSTGASLGAGLGQYFQWLDRGGNRWLNADQSEVIRLRERVLPRSGRRCADVALDLTVPGWWERLGLPGRRRGSGRRAAGAPVLLICEGVLMYLEPEQVQAVLREIGEHAPTGSRLLLDLMSWLAIGQGQSHASVRHTRAEFRWGLRHRDELTTAHPRLRLDAYHPVLDGYGLPYAMAGPAFQFVFGVPLYAVAELGLDP